MNYRSAESVRMASMGVLVIAAVAAAAATIESTAAMASGSSWVTQTPLGEAIGGSGLNVTDGGGGPTGPGGDPGRQFGAFSTCVRSLAAWYGGLLYFGAFGGLLYAFKRTYSLGAAFLGMYATAPVVFTAYFLSTDCTSQVGPDGRRPLDNVLTVIPGGGPLSPDVSPWLVAGIFGLALVAFGAVLYRSSGDEETPGFADGEEFGGSDAEIADLAAAAGRAADRIEQYNADVDNAVYRAWWEMTSLLDVPRPESHTPGEFADAAVELGMDAGDVDALTELFEEVRYGRRDAESREDRALAVLRNIEAAYGGPDEVASDEASDGEADDATDEN